MLDRAWGGAIRRSGQNHPRETRKSARGCRRLHIEPLEGRTLLAASIAPIAPVTVQAGQGYQVPLNGSGSATPQTFTVTSSNPDIKATVAQGQFLTLNVLHTASPSNPGDVSFSGPITFQLFNDLTPLTASKIESFVQNGDYNAGQFFRIANGFPGPSDYIIQGGTSADATQGNSNLPGTPFPDEFNPQLVFNGQGQLAMANAGPNTNGSQFFITTGSPQFLNFRHTIFGQLVSDPLNIVPRMTQVARQANPKTGESNTLPVSPIQITSASLSNANPNGVIHVDATQAHSGETSTITAVATDPSTNTTATQTFQVNTIAFGDTGAVRVIGRVLVVTPVPRAGRHTNTITVSQMTSPTGTANDTLQVNVNGTIDTIQPLVSAIDRIVVFGSKASDKITIDPSVDPAIAVTLDGGHGGLHNRLQAGDNSTREHGWFGFNTLVGGSGSNQLVGRAGHVKFVPTPTTTEIFAGNPEPGGSFFHPHPPGGTFFKFVKGRLVPIPTPT